MNPPFTVGVTKSANIQLAFDKAPWFWFSQPTDRVAVDFIVSPPYKLMASLKSVEASCPSIVRSQGIFLDGKLPPVLSPELSEESFELM